jgi:uncharacterized protein (DUF983 family)
MLALQRLVALSHFHTGRIVVSVAKNRDIAPQSDLGPCNLVRSGLSRPKRTGERRMATDTTTDIAPDAETRLAKPAMLRGWRRRCPNCGDGPMLKGYLKVRDACPVCHEELHHHRADDGPAYLTILVVGHLMAPFLHMTFSHIDQPDPLIVATVFSVACVALSLYLLPRIKGGLIGLQWAKRMHGFKDA